MGYIDPKYGYKTDVQAPVHLLAVKPAPERSYPAERLLYFHIGQFTKGYHAIDLFKSGLKQGYTAGDVLMIR